MRSAGDADRRPGRERPVQPRHVERGPDSPGVRGRTSCFRRTASPPAASGPAGVLTIHFGHRSEGWKGAPR
ncbi:hypothetical protein DDE74_19680 [Streptomyces lydicus]|uniref:Uncharacterized protein n=1 Tax=Streptomyces lydicus TaxID=47763 RepID=A0A3Q9K756_9ACTN|nr:hypothetical protein DDE74_19680 [Streptomyces lydicus]